MKGKSFEEVYNEYRGLIERLATKYYVNGMDRDDLIQEFTMVLHRCFISFDEAKKLNLALIYTEV